MRKLVALTSHMGFYSGNPGMIYAGDVVEVPEALADRLIHKGLLAPAVAVVKPVPAAPLDLGPWNEDEEADAEPEKVDKRSKAYRDAQKAKG